MVLALLLLLVVRVPAPVFTLVPRAKTLGKGRETSTVALYVYCRRSWFVTPGGRDGGKEGSLDDDTLVRESLVFGVRAEPTCLFEWLPLSAA